MTSLAKTATPLLSNLHDHRYSKAAVVADDEQLLSAFCATLMNPNRAQAISMKASFCQSNTTRLSTMKAYTAKRTPLAGADAMPLP